MFNHNRGLWGYTGMAPDGGPLTIQSTGMGGPSAAIVIAELIDLGGDRLLRVGTCGALARDLALGDLLIVTRAMAEDGTSRALGADGLLAPDPTLLERLRFAAGDRAREATVVSADLFYDGAEGQEAGWRDAGAEAVEMETATLFALAARRQVQAASLLVVSDLLLPTRRRIDAADLGEAEDRLGRAGLDALTAGEREPAA
jgi:uridine phosphorylase